MALSTFIKYVRKQRLPQDAFARRAQGDTASAAAFSS
jgi:hypothetical protein